MVATGSEPDGELADGLRLVPPRGQVRDQFELHAPGTPGGYITPDLSRNAMILLSDKDFSGQRLVREGDWAVGFGADWCPFCRSFRKSYEKLDGQVSFHVGWADVSDYESPLWTAFDLDVIPTLMVFRGEVLSWRKDGKAGVGLSSSDLDTLRASFP